MPVADDPDEAAMIDIKQILCPVDLSSISRRALDAALVLAHLYRARVCALEVIDTAMPPLPLGPHEQYVLMPEMREAYSTELASFVRAGESPEVGIDVRVTEGRPVPEILREAEMLPADLIVMGTHGRGGFNRFILGSVTENVLRKSGCPVLTIPPAGPAAVDAAAPFASILCAVDFSFVSHQAVAAAAELANRFHGALTVVHVFDWAFGEHVDQMPPAIVELGRSLQDHARWQLHECVAGVRVDQAPAEVVALGRPAREILHVARDRAADLIVMGVTGRGSLDLALIGSTANHVVRASSCPVLTVRAPAHGRLVMEHAGAASARVH